MNTIKQGNIINLSLLFGLLIVIKQFYFVTLIPRHFTHLRNRCSIVYKISTQGSIKDTANQEKSLCVFSNDIDKESQWIDKK